MSHVTVLAGGLGSAKFLVGLVETLSEEQVHTIVNVGDDTQEWGLHVSPDIDCILHALAGELDPARDWVRSGQSYQCYETSRKLGLKSGSKIGDRDMATHLVRTSLLRTGKNLEEATVELADRFGLGLTIIPATSDPVRTVVETAEGDMSVGEFYLSDSSEATGVRYEGAGSAQASPSAIDSILSATRVIVAPSDPIRSIGAIVAIPAIRDALSRTEAGVVAVSPVVGTHPVKGPGPGLEALMRATGSENLSARDVALRYRDFLNHLVIHTSDLPVLDEIRDTGLGVWVENILISSPEDAARLSSRLVGEGRPISTGA
jgi:LPPG:FO 2-phospho-L-lactate transferase